MPKTPPIQSALQHSVLGIRSQALGTSRIQVSSGPHPRESADLAEATAGPTACLDWRLFSVGARQVGSELTAVQLFQLSAWFARYRTMLKIAPAAIVLASLTPDQQRRLVEKIPQLLATGGVAPKALVAMVKPKVRAGQTLETPSFEAFALRHSLTEVSRASDARHWRCRGAEPSSDPLRSTSEAQPRTRRNSPHSSLRMVRVYVACCRTAAR